MDTEKQITKRMKNLRCSRLNAIASMNLGKRSEAAKRVLAKRKRRKELVEECDMDFEIACLVVNKENERT